MGGGTIYSNGFFLFSHYWPFDIFIVEKCDKVSLKSSSSVEFKFKKKFFEISYFSRSYRGLKFFVNM